MLYPLPRARTFAALVGFLVLGLAAVSSAAVAQHPNVVVILADDQGWGDSERARQHEPRHAAHRFAGPRRRAVRAVLRLPGLLAHAGRVSHRPLSSARRRVQHVDRRRTARPRRDDDRRHVQGRRLRHRRVRQVAQRHAVSLSSQRPRLRRVLRLLLRATGATTSIRCWNTTARPCAARASSPTT